MRNKRSLKEILMERWGVTSWWQIFIIFVVFGLTGSSSVFIGKSVMNFLGISDNTDDWLRIPSRILIVFIVYQLLLLWIGFLFGQFKFFWNFEKKMFGRIAGLFKRKETI